MKRLQRINQFMGRTVSGGEEERMKRNRITRFVFFIAIGVTAVCAAKTPEVQAKKVYLTKKAVPDKAVRSQLKRYDKNKNGILEKKEQKKIKELILYKSKGTLNVKGISVCTNLQLLSIETRGKVKNTKEISKLKNLKKYYLQSADTTFHVNKNTKLEELELYQMKGLKEIKLEKNKSLKTVEIYECNQVKKIDMKGNKKLKKIEIARNKKLKEITITDNPKVKSLRIDLEKDLNRLNMKRDNELETLEMNGRISCKIKELQLGEFPRLKSFCLTRLSMSDIILRKMPNLLSFTLWYNKFTTIDFSKNTKLENFEIYSPDMRELDVSELPALKVLKVGGGQMRTLKTAEKNRIESMNLSNNLFDGEWNLNKYPYLSVFCCDNNKIEKITAAGHQNLSSISCENNNLGEINTFGMKELRSLYAKGNPNADISLPRKPDEELICKYDETARVTYPVD